MFTTDMDGGNLYLFDVGAWWTENIAREVNRNADAGYFSPLSSN